MLIDVRTLYLAVALVQFALPLGVILSLAGRQSSEVYWWCGLGALSGVGSILFGLRGHIPPYLSIFLAQSILIVAVAGHNFILLRWLNKLNRKYIIGYTALVITDAAILSIHLIWQLSDYSRILCAFLVVILFLLHRLLIGLELIKKDYIAAGRMIQINASLIILSISIRLFDVSYKVDSINIFKDSSSALIALILLLIGLLLFHFAYIQMILTKATGDLIIFHKEMNKTLGKTQVLEEKMIRREKQFKELSSNAGINGFAAFSGAIAHELSQPLAAMLLNIDRMIRHLTKMNAEPALLADLHRIKLDNARANNIIKSIRLLLRDDAPLLEAPLQIDQLVRDAVYVSKKDIMANNILFTQNDHLGSVQIPGHDGLLLQVITNLINNAINATSGVAAPHINLSTIGNNDYVFLVLSDNGCGINQSDSEAVFLPFKSISEHGRDLGLGLGLSIIQTIIKKHNGDIGYIENAEAGVTFIVGLPRTVDTPAYVFNQAMASELIGKYTTLLQTSLSYSQSFNHQTISS